MNVPHENSAAKETPDDHLDEQTLRAFSVGEISEPEADRITRHLRSCDACAQALECMTVGNDPLVARLREAHQETDSSASGRTVVPDPPTTTDESWDTGFEPIAGYKVIKRLGAGGFGEVWEATAAGGIPAALKKVNLDSKRRLGEAELFALELLKRVRHPHLLSIHGFWIVDSTLVIACELADESLDKATSEPDGVTAVEQVLRYLNDAAEALDYLGRPIHSVNNTLVRIQHCDVKPANLLLQGGAVKVADFGLAQPLQGIVRNRSFAGTPAYAPPEFFKGNVTASSDQYSLAVTYYRLRTGRLPFSGNIEEIAAGHVRGTPNLEGLTPDEQRIVARALSKDPALRWHSCTKLISELQRIHWQSSLSTSDETDSQNGNSAQGSSPQGPADPFATTVDYRGKPVTSGMILIEETLIPAPLKSTKIHITVTGVMSEVEFTQTFFNAADCAVNVTYVFPLPDDAAVLRMRMTVDDRVIESQIQEQSVARRMYAAAMGSGKKAALLEQSSPKVFTSCISSILPGQEVKVEFVYLQAMPFQKGMYRLAVPMRISSESMHCTDLAGKFQSGNNAQPGIPPGWVAGSQRSDLVSIEVQLDAGVPLRGFDSPSHDIETVAEEGASRVWIRLRSGEEIPDRDFILTFRVRGPAIEHAVFYEPELEGTPGTFLLLTTPPFSPIRITLPRRVVLVLGGRRIKDAKKVALSILDQLCPNDEFNVLTYGSRSGSLADSFLPASRDQLLRARSLIESLDAEGSSSDLHLVPVFQKAFQQLALEKPSGTDGSSDVVRRLIRRLFRRKSSEQQPDPSKALQEKLLIFINGGLGDQHPEFLFRIRPLIGKSRVIGIRLDSADNGLLMNRLAEVSHGISELVSPDQDLHGTLNEILNRLSPPILTDIELVYDSKRIFDVLPQQVPDLYCHRPLQIMGRFAGKVPPRIVLRGRSDGTLCEYEIEPEHVGRNTLSSSLSVLWARRKIEALSQQLETAKGSLLPSQRSAEAPGTQSQHLNEAISRCKALRGQITELAIRYRLVTPFTSFVAVEHSLNADGEQPGDSIHVVVPPYLPSEYASRNKSVHVALDQSFDYGAAPPTAVPTFSAPAWSTGSTPKSNSFGAKLTGRVLQPLSRIRKPRVNITYDVEAGGASLHRDLPFVIGVIGSFSGAGSEETQRRKNWCFATVDRDNVEELMKDLDVGLDLPVPNRLQTTDIPLAVSLKFRSLRDFEPENILAQVPALSELAAKRSLCQELLASGQIEFPPQDRFAGLLKEVIPQPLENFDQLATIVRSALLEWDATISKQVLEIVNHPEFLILEGTWRGLYHLITHSETGMQLRLQVLNIRKEDLHKDLCNGANIVESAFFRLIWNEITLAGGQPFAALIGDFEFSLGPSDVLLLSKLAAVCAETSCPFISAESRSGFVPSEGLDLSSPGLRQNSAVTAPHKAWDEFRQTEAARFIGLVTRPVLARPPVDIMDLLRKGPTFEKATGKIEGSSAAEFQSHACWMNPAYIFAIHLARCISETGTTTSFFTLEVDRSAAQPVQHDVPAYDLEEEDLLQKEQTGNEWRARIRQGLIVLMFNRTTKHFAYPAASACYKGDAIEDSEPARESVIADSLPYQMGVFRFVAFVRCILRDKLSADKSIDELRKLLNEWIEKFVCTEQHPSHELRSRFPLAEADISVQEHPGQKRVFRVRLSVRQYLPSGEISKLQTCNFHAEVPRA